MKISDFIHRYPTGTIRRHDGICRVRIFINRDFQKTILVTELGDKNTSTSITNAIENVYTSLKEKGFAFGEDHFIEHYEKGSIGENTFDIVKFNEISQPSWKSITKSEAKKMLDCDEKEITSKYIENEKLLSEIEKIRTQIDPYIDFSNQEPAEKISRRFEIESKMISKSYIENFISKSPTENEIQNLLKKDLSVFSETYSESEDEYICFSEFPLDDGYVDFVVFSGRSWMNITLIEIKGSNFDLTIKNHYGKFNSKIEEANQQIRKRQRYIYENISMFSNFSHKIRERVESGEKIYNSLLGPHGRLEVDPLKDITVRYVIIGGKTRDDLKESKQRHDYERSTKPSIKIESWDTWIRKLRRN